MTEPATAARTPIQIEHDFTYLVVHERAKETLDACRNHVNALAQAFGDGHEYTTKAALSLARQTTLLVTNFFGQTNRISRDGDLSLFVSTSSGFVYGVIFHRRFYDAVQAPSVDERPHIVWCSTCETPVCTSDMGPEPHRGHFTTMVPAPGDWSSHS